jgi:hypothetical protein
LSSLKGNKADVHQWATGKGDIGQFDTTAMTDQEIAGHSSSDIGKMNLDPETAGRILNNDNIELTGDKRAALAGFITNNSNSDDDQNHDVDGSTSGSSERFHGGGFADHEAAEDYLNWQTGNHEIDHER